MSWSGPWPENLSHLILITWPSAVSDRWSLSPWRQPVVSRTFLSCYFPLVVIRSQICIHLFLPAVIPLSDWLPTCQVLSGDVWGLNLLHQLQPHYRLMEGTARPPSGEQLHNILAGAKVKYNHCGWTDSDDDVVFTSVNTTANQWSREQFTTNMVLVTWSCDPSDQRFEASREPTRAWRQTWACAAETWEAAFRLFRRRIVRLLQHTHTHRRTQTHTHTHWNKATRLDESFFEKCDSYRRRVLKWLHR